MVHAFHNDSQQYKVLRPLHKHHPQCSKYFHFNWFRTGRYLTLVLFYTADSVNSVVNVLAGSLFKFALVLLGVVEAEPFNHLSTTFNYFSKYILNSSVLSLTNSHALLIKGHGLKLLQQTQEWWCNLCSRFVDSILNFSLTSIYHICVFIFLLRTNVWINIFWN